MRAAERGGPAACSPPLHQRRRHGQLAAPGCQPACHADGLQPGPAFLLSCCLQRRVRSLPTDHELQAKPLLDLQCRLHVRVHFQGMRVLAACRHAHLCRAVRAHGACVTGGGARAAVTGQRVAPVGSQAALVLSTVHGSCRHSCGCW